MSGDRSEAIRPDGTRDSPAYRAIRFDAHGGVGATETVAARTDAEALAAVRAMDRRDGVDLWDRNRLVASFPPAGSLGPA